MFEVEVEKVSSNLKRVQEKIAEACSESGRSVDDVEILAATKYVDIGQLGALADAGVEHLGENRAADLIEKKSRWGDTFTWDFIGNLQSRKVKLILPEVRLIHSVCTDSALAQIDRWAGGPVVILIEVNVAREQSKPGLLEEDIDQFIENASKSERVHISGLMAMPPLADSAESSRRYFSLTRELSERLSRKWSPRHSFVTLSMGTSQDYQVAIEEGATIVRLGSVLFI